MLRSAGVWSLTPPGQTGEAYPALICTPPEVYRPDPRPQVVVVGGAVPLRQVQVYTLQRMPSGRLQFVVHVTQEVSSRFEFLTLTAQPGAATPVTSLHPQLSRRETEAQ